jgi:RNA polymerase sigma-70 factor (ECF subfamily)
LATNLTTSDIELMQRVASFDSKALEALYDRYSPLLFTLVKKIVSDEKLAEEVLSEIFAIIWQKIHLFDFKSGDVYTWLILLSRNKATDTLKRQNGGDVFGKYDDEYENNFIIPHLSPVIDVVDIQTALSIKDSFEAALNKLTDAQQYVIYLAFYEGLTQKEIATKLNIPLQTVKSKIIIALKNLRENLIKGDS